MSATTSPALPDTLRDRVTLTVAAAAVGLSEKPLRRRIVAGELDAMRFRGRIYVREDDVRKLFGP